MANEMELPAPWRRLRGLTGHLTHTSRGPGHLAGPAAGQGEDDGAKNILKRWRAPSPAGGQRETASEPVLPLIDPVAERQLFLDDSAIATEKGCSRRVHSPTKAGACISGGVPQARCCPVWNSELALWEWWYMGPNGTHYATSVDGESWDLPRVGRWEVDGSLDNNVATDPTMPGVYSVIRDEGDPDPSKRYKGLFGGTYGSGRRRGISADGFTWDFLGDDEASEIPSQDESQFTWDPYEKRWLAMVKLPTEHGRSVWLSQATDFCGEFSTPELILHADEVDHQNAKDRVAAFLADPTMLSPPIVEPPGTYNAEVYNMAVMPYRGLYVGFPTIYNPIGAIPPPETNSTRTANCNINAKNY